MIKMIMFLYAGKPIALESEYIIITIIIVELKKGVRLWKAKNSRLRVLPVATVL